MGVLITAFLILAWKAAKVQLMGEVNDITLKRGNHVVRRHVDVVQVCFLIQYVRQTHLTQDKEIYRAWLKTLHFGSILVTTHWSHHALSLGENLKRFRSSYKCPKIGLHIMGIQKLWDQVLVQVFSKGLGSALILFQSVCLSLVIIATVQDD